MYGANLYGGNEYGSRKLFGSVTGPVIKLTMKVLTGIYGGMNYLQLRFRTLTLNNPKSNQNTLTL